VWWLHPELLSGENKLLFYVGMAALAGGWLGLGRAANASTTTPLQLGLVAVLWSLPLAVGAPLFSRDVYSYFAQGTMAHLGLDPYSQPPSVLHMVGHAHVLGAVDPFWRSTTAPYGPLFLAAVSVIAAIVGSHLVLAALVVRAFDLVGLALLAIFVPRLARRCDADPARAVWLAVLSPLILLQLVAPAHNDLLMAGVMVAGVTVALRGRPLLGIAICTLAAMIKLPALAAVIFLAVGWIRVMPTWKERAASAARALAAVAGTALVVTLISGFGTSWLSSTLFSAPARVHLAITPATDISWTIAPLLHDLGLAVTFHGLESVLQVIALAAAAAVALVLLRRESLPTTPQCLGLALIAFALGGPAVWPWYFSWGLVLLAAWRPAQRSRVLVVAILVGSFLVKPNGIFVLPVGSSPVLVGVWVVIAAAAWIAWRRRDQRRMSVGLGEGSIAPAHSTLAGRWAR
jgi:hypothetical protein